MVEIRKPGPYRRVTGRERDRLGAELARRYRKGASVRVLMEATGRSAYFVRRLLAENGVILRAAGGMPAKGPRAEVVRRYRKGETIRQIADTVDFSYGWVHGVLKAKNVLRQHGGPRQPNT